ncbi:MAG: hypothetical protein HZB39_16870 [Planctomycetes bacterium]|nr:hypothetical protein [Planctomycetota bacterium]
MRRILGSALLVCASLALPACNNNGSTATFLVGGSVSGLTSGTLTLQINGGETVDLSADGAFNFPTRLAQGVAYAITVASAPAGFLATVTDGSGTVTGAVTNVAVAVSERSYTISGAVSGLNGTIVLQVNGGDDVTLTADGPFTFPTPVANGTPFAITIASAPSGQECAVAALENGVVNLADITGIAIICLDRFTLGGTVSGLGDHVVLRNNGTNEITRTIDGAFTFPGTVVDGRGYEVTVEGGSTTQRYAVTNGSGRVDGANVTNVAIDCADKNWWHPAVPADNRSHDNSSADGARAAIAANGDSLIAWHQSDGSNTQIYLSECRGGVWTNPTGATDNISLDGQNALWPDVAMNEDGDAIVAWSQSDGTNARIYVSQYRSGAWSHPSAFTDAINPASTDAFFPQVALADNGDAIVTWFQSDGSDYQVFASTFRFAVWSHPASLTTNLSPDGEDAVFAQVAMDEDGDAVVAWQQNDGTATHVFVSTFSAGIWTNPASLAAHASPVGGNAEVPSLAVNAGGDAVLSWAQSDGVNLRVYFSQRVAGTWTNPASITAAISPSTTDAFVPRTAIATDGDAMIVWYQSDGANLQVFRSERRSGTWTHPSNLADNMSPDGNDAGVPFAGMSANGDAVIAWRQFDGTYFNVLLAECRDGTWTIPATVGDDIGPGGSSAIDLRVVVSRSGNVNVVWTQSDASFDAVYVSEYR